MDFVRTHRRPADAVLITEARQSADEEFANRRRRYLVMMSGRAVCVLGAVLVFNYSGWLAACFLIGAAVLPWSAVLLANASPAKQAVRFRRFLPSERGPAQLGASEHGAGDPKAPRAPGGDQTDGSGPGRIIDL